MIFIAGVQSKKRKLSSESRICPACHHHEMEQIRVDHYIALFFIPLFPVKRGHPFWKCTKCDAVIEGDQYADTKSKEKCPFCSGVIRKNYTFCPHCGRSL